MATRIQPPVMTAGIWLTLLVLSVLWGGSFFFVGVLVRELPPLSVAAGRVTLAAAALLPLLWLLGQRPPGGSGLWLAFLGMGLLNNVIPFTLFAWAQGQIPSGLAAILNASTPISTALVAHVCTADEKLSPGRALGVLLGLAGVAVMLGPDLLAGLGDNLAAQLVCLAATFSYACAGVFGRRFRHLGVSPPVTAGYQLLASTLVLVPLALLFDRPWTLAAPSGEALAALAGLALLSTALAYVLFFRVMAAAGSNANLVTLLVPVSAILLGVVVLGEALLPRHFAGLVVIALGLAAIDGRLAASLRRQPG